jgi:hypothetical protein
MFGCLQGLEEEQTICQNLERRLGIESLRLK